VSAPDPVLVVVAGPTASGKGALARAIARRFAGELVSADSRKIFKGLDIGTAKPGPAERAGLGYHLLDLLGPGEACSAARFALLADLAIADIHARGRTPVVVGGTGLYLRALLFGMIETPPRDDALRARLGAEERARPGSLHARLREIDLASAERLGPADTLRLVRALEVHALTGRPLSALQAEHGFRKPRYAFLALAPDWPWPELAARIARRVEAMLAAGWLEEVAALLWAGDERVRAVLGYRELAAHLEGRLERERAVEAVVGAHRRYARYQLGLFRRFPGLVRVPAPVAEEAVLARVEGFLAQWKM
jgi:tRNA dimethylallyltransferase